MTMPDSQLVLGQILARLDNMDERGKERDEKLQSIADRIGRMELLDSRRAGQQSMLYWIGAAIIAAAGGTGAFVAKILGFVAYSK